MRASSERYFTALHEIQHIILSYEAGNIDKEMAEKDVAAVARHVPSLHRAWSEDRT